MTKSAEGRCWLVKAGKFRVAKSPPPGRVERSDSEVAAGGPLGPLPPFCSVRVMCSQCCKLRRGGGGCAGCGDVSDTVDCENWVAHVFGRGDCCQPLMPRNAGT